MRAALKYIEAKGKYETARRCRSFVSRVFRYAVANLKAENDPAAVLKGALRTLKPKHRSAIQRPEEVGQLLRAIDECAGHAITRYAMQIAPHVMARPGELRMATWDEFNLDTAEWHIPAEQRPNVIALLAPSTCSQAIVCREKGGFRPYTIQRWPIAARSIFRFGGPHDLRVCLDGDCRAGRDERAPATIAKLRWPRQELLPTLGHRPPSDIRAYELLAVLRHAIITARATRNPAVDLKGAIASPKPKHMAAIIDPQRVGELLR